MRCRIGMALLALFGMAGPPLGAGELGTTTPIHVGMPETMVADLAESQVEILEKKFALLMKEFTGLKGQLHVGDGPFDVASRLDEGQLQLAIFQGVEFAWVRAKYPTFQPLMIALSTHPKIEVLILTRKEGGAEGFAGLKGKRIALPKKSKEPARLFLENVSAKAGGDLKSFFKEITSPPNPEKALDDLVAGKVDAVVADKVAVEFYQRIKPGVFGRLKVLQTSEPFPPGVIAYKKGALSDALLDRFKKGMLKANKSERGQDLMANWNITSFEPVPADYARDLEAILKSYPAPTGKATKK